VTTHLKSVSSAQSTSSARVGMLGSQSYEKLIQQNSLGTVC